MDGSDLKRRRKEAGLSLCELGQLAGVEPGRLEAQEAGRSVLPPGTLYRIRLALAQAELALRSEDAL